MCIREVQKTLSQSSKRLIEMKIAEQTLTLNLRDNGCGFDTSHQSDGHGLLSLRERAKGIGGEIEIDSKPGSGTTVKLSVPIAT